MSRLQVVLAGPERAEEVVRIIHRSFGARPVLDPPATAMDETAETVAAGLRRDGGLLALRDNQAVGTMLFNRDRAGLLGMRRVSVDPAAQIHGVASAMVGVAENVAAESGAHGLWLYVREELPNTIRFWSRRGYYPIGRDEPLLEFGKELGAQFRCDSVDQTHQLAGHLAAVARPGDLLVLSGELGAGKTTFVQGFGAALRVRGPITSPTFVIARVHPSLTDGPALVHVDAYRLGGAEEIDDLDLDVEHSVTVVEWGSDMAEQLADSHLEIIFERTDAEQPADEPDETRRVTIRPHGLRWFGSELASLGEKARGAGSPDQDRDRHGNTVR